LGGARGRIEIGDFDILRIHGGNPFAFADQAKPAGQFLVIQPGDPCRRGGCAALLPVEHGGAILAFADRFNQCLKVGGGLGKRRPRYPCHRPWHQAGPSLRQWRSF
jgi:hypothetical protein